LHIPGWQLEAVAGTSERNQRIRVATTNDIKNGTVLKLEGQLWNIIEFQQPQAG